jgi:nucleotide-binding universal stress UspA family protein
MEKLNSILVVVESLPGGLAVLDKAIQVARFTSARIELLLHDSTQVCTYASHCTKQGYPEVMLYSVHRDDEPLHEVVLRRVMQQRPDLIIKQSSGPHPLRRWTLRENDWLLIQECPMPVLLAGSRPWNQPLRLAAACDVADREAEAVTRSILQSAGFLALGSHGELDILYCERELRDETLRMERAVKLSQLVREFHVGSESIHMLAGRPEETMPEFIAGKRYDLLVLGAVTHRSGLGAVLSSLTSKLADATQEGDLLLVKGSVPAEIPAPRQPVSRREEIPDQCEQFV